MTNWLVIWFSPATNSGSLIFPIARVNSPCQQSLSLLAQFQIQRYRFLKEHSEIVHLSNCHCRLGFALLRNISHDPSYDQYIIARPTKCSRQRIMEGDHVLDRAVLQWSSFRLALLASYAICLTRKSLSCMWSLATMCCRLPCDHFLSKQTFSIYNSLPSSSCLDA